MRVKQHMVSSESGEEVATQEIKKGYDTIGRKIPDFSKITRKGLALEMQAFKKALEATPNADAQAFYDKYLQGFWEFKPDVILTQWI